MTAQQLGADRELAGADPVAAAAEHVAARALRPGPVGRVGLELEFHVVDLAAPLRRPGWDVVGRLPQVLPRMPSGSAVTLEPGGQVELSTPCAADVVAAVAALRADVAALRTGLRELRLGPAALGADPARPVRRTNPRPRYRAMERHFAAVGCGTLGQRMMSATAALQVNLDAGPERGWRDRLELMRRLVPVLVAASAGSPYLGGRASGWQSMRQETWQGIDRLRTAPVRAGEPSAAWARYALEAPVMLTREGDRAHPVTRRVPFVRWLRGDGPVERPPTLRDLDHHLTTLFPPVRPRGYVEIRCIDALPDRWWPAMAALAVTLLDDPIAADRAAELCEPVAEAWQGAARDGMADHRIRGAVTGCATVAAERCPSELGAEVAAFAELLAGGQTPADLIRRRAEQVGPGRVLEEEAHA